MSKIQRMSDSEKEVMQLVWATGGPVTSARLLEQLNAAGKDWKTNTVLTFLARLVEKGLLTAVRHGRSNMYIPRLGPDDYRRFETRLFLEDVHDGSVKSLIAALFDERDITKREIDELKAWFDERGGSA